LSRNRGILVEGDAGGGQFGDQGFVEGIVPIGAIHPDRRDPVGSFDFYSPGH